MNLFSNSRIRSRFTEFNVPIVDLHFLDEYQREPIVSLEKSVENLLFSIVFLDKYVKMAKDNCNKSGRYGLTVDESSSIYLYTIEWNEGSSQSFYFILNETLRSGNYFRIRSYFPYLKLFCTALNKLPSIQTELWRNLQGNLIDYYSKSKLFRWSTIISCSSNIDQIFKTFWNSNGQNTLFQIESFNGKNISAYSRFTNENEVILLPGTTFSVRGHSISKHLFHGYQILVTQITEIN